MMESVDGMDTQLGELLADLGRVGFRDGYSSQIEFAEELLGGALGAIFEDAKEGPAAFREKRKPNFKGN